VHVQPRATRPGIAGQHGTALKVRVDAPPLDGRANSRVLEIVADALGVPRRSVRLVLGDSSREKVIEVDDLSPHEVRARLGL
jgi:uncharacterized protein (TIGR00251 family)